MSQPPTVALEPPMLAAQRVLLAGIDQLAGTDSWPLSDDDVAVALHTFTVLEARLAAAKLAVIADADTRRLGAADATNTAGWLRGRLLLGPGDATRAVGLARALRTDCVATGAALAAGGVSVEQARVIVAAIAGLPPLDAATKSKAEEFLITHAAALDPMLLRRTAEALTETLTTEPDRDDKTLRDIGRRELTATPAADGMIRLHGCFDAQGWAQIAAVLHPLAAPPARRRRHPRPPHRGPPPRRGPPRTRVARRHRHPTPRRHAAPHHEHHHQLAGVPHRATGRDGPAQHRRNPHRHRRPPGRLRIAGMSEVRARRTDGLTGGARVSG